jgi:hypothetical protein
MFCKIFVQEDVESFIKSGLYFELFITVFGKSLLFKLKREKI